MKIHSEQWNLLFDLQPQVHISDEKTEYFSALQFDVCANWTKLPQSESVIYFFMSEPIGSMSVQRITPEAMDEVELDAFSILKRFAEGMQEELSQFSPVFMQEHEELLDNAIPCYAFRYNVVVTEEVVPNCSILLLLGQTVYCLTFSEKLFPYGVDILRSIKVIPEEKRDRN